VAIELFAKLHAAASGHIKAVDVLDLVSSEYFGHVYNLETREGWYFANGIITHNCECDVVAVLKEEESDNE
jgi:hypothetical protein